MKFSYPDGQQMKATKPSQAKPVADAAELVERAVYSLRSRALAVVVVTGVIGPPENVQGRDLLGSSVPDGISRVCIGGKTPREPRYRVLRTKRLRGPGGRIWYSMGDFEGGELATNEDEREYLGLPATDSSEVHRLIRTKTNMRRDMRPSRARPDRLSTTLATVEFAEPVLGIQRPASAGGIDREQFQKMERHGLLDIERESMSARLERAQDPAWWWQRKGIGASDRPRAVDSQRSDSVPGEERRHRCVASRVRHIPSPVRRAFISITAHAFESLRIYPAIVSFVRLLAPLVSAPSGAAASSSPCIPSSSFDPPVMRSLPVHVFSIPPPGAPGTKCLSQAAGFPIYFNGTAFLRTAVPDASRYSRPRAS
ncbi:hypothetical protein FB451DRAFT_1165056 [Mycena latifolia]|nr:hypothetical protein FB451DRAFT_1165056 [Mycena latifolia]